MSSQHKMLLKINAQNRDKYLVVWDNHSQEWINEQDISPYALGIYREIEHLSRDIVIPMENPKSALIYCRSTTGQIENQKKISAEYCRDNCYNIEYLVKDDVSGRKMKNMETELGYFIPHLNSDNVIVVTNPEVLGKDVFKVVKFLCEMFRRGIDVHFVEQNIVWNKDTTPEEKFKIRQILNQEELKSDTLSKKYKDEQIRLRMKGHRTGKPPFGFRASKINGIRKFVEYRKEQKIINDTMNLYNKLVNDKKYSKKEIYEIVFEKLKEKSIILENPNFIKKIITRQERIFNESIKLLETKLVI